MKAFMRFLSRFKLDLRRKALGTGGEAADPFWQCFQVLGGGRWNPGQPLKLQWCFLSGRMPCWPIGHRPTR